MVDTQSGKNTANVKICDNFIAQLQQEIQSEIVLLVTSPGFVTRGTVQKILAALPLCEIIVCDTIQPNPELQDLEYCAKSWVNKKITNIIALGGGSVIDSAKVFAALLSNSRHSLRELLLAGHAESRVNLIAIPTTAGTGAEVTPFATVWERALGKKHSLHGVTPTVALLDASLTITLPYEQTIYPALDTMSHALESLWNKNKTAESAKNAQDALVLLCEALPLVQQAPKNQQARKKLQIASMFAGLAITQTRTALAHAMSYPLTANYAVPHGLACSFTLRAILLEVGSNSLNLSVALTEKIEILLTELCLDKALSHYVNWTQLSGLYNQPLHASRAGNFILNFDQTMLQRILSNSWSLSKEI